MSKKYFTAWVDKNTCESGVVECEPKEMYLAYREMIRMVESDIISGDRVIGYYYIEDTGDLDMTMCLIAWADNDTGFNGVVSNRAVAVSDVDACISDRIEEDATWGKDVSYTKLSFTSPLFLSDK